MEDMDDLRNQSDPPGLLAREQVESGTGPDGPYVVIEETWDVSVPGCPFVVMNWNRQELVRKGRVLSQRKMTEAEWLYGRAKSP